MATPFIGPRPVLPPSAQNPATRGLLECKAPAPDRTPEADLFEVARITS